MSRTLVATTYQSRFFEKKKNAFLKRFLKKLEVNFLENSIFSYGTKLKTKILALICSSAELWLHFKTFPSFLAFEMVEKSWKYRQIKHKKHFREKRKTSSKKVSFWCYVFQKNCCKTLKNHHKTYKPYCIRKYRLWAI